MLRASTICAALARRDIRARDRRGSPHQRRQADIAHRDLAKLTFTSKDGVPLSGPAGTDDPSTAGAVVELFSQAQPGGASLVQRRRLDRGGCSATEGPIASLHERAAREAVARACSV
jgi:hypothetical protein